MASASGKQSKAATFTQPQFIASFAGAPMDYDAVAVPCKVNGMVAQQRRSAFKVKPNSVSYVGGTTCVGNSASAVPFDAIPEDAT